MKIRNGFVSNSSSSSFCIYGFKARFEDSSNPDADELWKRLKEEGEKKLKLESDGRDDLYTVAEEVCIMLDAGLIWDGERDQCYIGRSWTDMKDLETAAEFKDGLASSMAKISGIEQEKIKKLLGTHLGTVYC